MRKLSYIFLLSAAFQSCDQHTDLAKKEGSAPTTNRVYCSLNESNYDHTVETVLDSLVDYSRLQMDSSWTQHFEPGTVYGFALRDNGDVPERVLTFPFNDIKFRYYRNGYYFKYNHHKFPVDAETHEENLEFGNLSRFKYRNGDYLTFTGGIKFCNAGNCMVQLNHFYRLSGRPVQEIYQSDYVWNGFLIYGELNEDTLLDRLAFELNEYSGNEFVLLIKAQTFSHDNWIALQDKNCVEYSILLRTDEVGDSCFIIASNWFKALN